MNPVRYFLRFPSAILQKHIRKYTETAVKPTETQTINITSSFKYAAYFVGTLLTIGFVRSVKVVQAGTIGIRDLFGKVDQHTYPPGLHLINPLASMHTFSVKTQNLSVNVDVPSKEGLNIHLKVSALYRINPDKVRDIYTTIGKDYVGVVLQPHLGSVIRQVTSGYEAKDLYTSSARHMMHSDLTKQLAAVVGERGIVIEDTPLREIVLPEKLTQAIEEKLRSEQESQRMEFVLQRERLEAERKAIEAGGIAEFQKIVAEGVSDQLLRWKGIEATAALAESKNTKIIIVGGNDGLPLIFNTSDTISNESPDLSAEDVNIAAKKAHHRGFKDVA